MNGILPKPPVSLVYPGCQVRAPCFVVDLQPTRQPGARTRGPSARGQLTHSTRQADIATTPRRG